ncbi:histidine phosphatase family protein [Nocardioides anomalus]|uniref:Histidine phosphatase family protein n=1 Tax=Nocardioides anomalus TaxID=2712223 RepID=A0A6G6WAR7_9ACTN|nr:histidine phosphatase family protein [Nocardioides anomalus]QIG42428.1 histidine phosphatase family protein [Nocardioides anomalus]
MSALQCPTTLVVARHGEAAYESALWGDHGGSLTALGRRQATQLGESLRGRRIAHVWCSTMARAVQTAELAAAVLGVEVTTREGLREFGVGEHAGVPRAEDPFVETYLGWREGRVDTRVPGGETGREIAERVTAVLREVADAHPGETVLVVSHGGAIGLGVPAAARLLVEQRRLGNGDTVEVTADAEGWACTRWGPDA